jgi:hypothetical protein
MDVRRVNTEVRLVGFHLLLLEVGLPKKTCFTTLAPANRQPDQPRYFGPKFFRVFVRRRRRPAVGQLAGKPEERLVQPEGRRLDSKRLHQPRTDCHERGSSGQTACFSFQRNSPGFRLIKLFTSVIYECL